jgi:glucose-1-phosphate cytidylyltransferase
MKVVLFCGGLGTRLREHTDTVPKPMVNIGQRPMLWHLMKYYSHFGHREFILCLGHMGEQVKQYFINYMEWVSNDFQLSGDTNEIHLFNRDIADWKITFADTGINTSIGERLVAVRHYLEDDPVFLANYSDGLSDLPLDTYLEYFQSEDRIASFVRVRPDKSFHTVAAGADNLVRDISAANQSDIWINGGFFAFKRELFDYLGAGQDLVEEPFQRLIAARQLLAYPYEGFWACMDTYKDKKSFDRMEQRGDMPWQLWEPRR